MIVVDKHAFEPELSFFFQQISYKLASSPKSRRPHTGGHTANTRTTVYQNL